MPVNGRSKGAGYELEIARIVSVWWSRKPELAKARAEELPFRRAPLSGGWDTKAAASDLIVTDPASLPVKWPWAIELKKQECWDWEGLFKANAKWPVKAYWDQCCVAAGKSKLHPLVVFTKNRSPNYFAMSPQAMDVLQIPHISVTWLPFVVGKFDDLLALDPQQIVAVLGQLSSSSKQSDVAAAAPTTRGEEQAPQEGKRPGCRVPAGEPEPELEITKRKLRMLPAGSRVALAPLPVAVPEPSNPIPTTRPMMLKCYHGKWRKVPVPKKDLEPTTEKILGTTWR